MVWYGMVWYGTVWYGKSIVWHGMGWYEYGMVWKASGWMRVGGISGRQARATVGVGVCGACPVCACVPGRGGGAYTVSQDWSQSLPRNMRGPGEGKGRGGGIPPSPVILGTRAAQGSSLSCTGKHACASACSNMPRCSRARMPKPFETPQDTCGYMKRAKRALDVSANSRLPAVHVQRDQDLSVNMQCEGLHTQSRVIMQARQPTPKSAIRRAQHLLARRNASYATT